jgi:hypothetical protein
MKSPAFNVFLCESRGYTKAGQELLKVGQNVLEKGRLMSSERNCIFLSKTKLPNDILSNSKMSN